MANIYAEVIGDYNATALHQIERAANQHARLCRDYGDSHGAARFAALSLAIAELYRPAGEPPALAS